MNEDLYLVNTRLASNYVFSEKKNFSFVSIFPEKIYILNRASVIKLENFISEIL